MNRYEMILPSLILRTINLIGHSIMQLSIPFPVWGFIYSGTCAARSRAALACVRAEARTRFRTCGRARVRCAYQHADHADRADWISSPNDLNDHANHRKEHDQRPISSIALIVQSLMETPVVSPQVRNLFNHCPYGNG